MVPASTFRRGLLCLAACCSGLAWNVSLHADAIDDFVAAEMKTARIPALSLVVIQDGKVLKIKGYGHIGAKGERPATKRTIYEIGSVTKPFTAIALLMLVEDGKLKLDERIATYLPNTSDPWAKITVRQLLNHTSGIKSYTDKDVNNDWAKLARTDYSQAEIIKMVSKYPLRFNPGTKWKYSNTGYFLLGMVIERSSGAGYWKFLQDRIFTPLKMTRTGPSNTRRNESDRAIGYALVDGELERRATISASTAFAAGGVVSTVEDLAKWDQALSTGGLLTKASTREMWRQTKLSTGDPVPYGLGWTVKHGKRGLEVSHGGSTPGFTSIVYRYPQNLTVIVLMNRLGAKRSAITNTIARIIVAEYPKRN